MKKIYLLHFLSLFVSIYLQGVDIHNQMLMTTILTPTPLLEFNQKCKWENSYITYLKKALIPFCCCFCYTIKKNDIWQDVTENPWTIAMLMYLTAYYVGYIAVHNKQNKIDEEIVITMQHLFNFLIIGHGIYNKITGLSYDSQKKSITAYSHDLQTLQLFLNNAYNTWFILFYDYQERYKTKPLYAYQMNLVDIFEILQACTHEPDILPLVATFYDKNNIICDYKPILNYLENKLKQINHKVKIILPHTP